MDVSLFAELVRKSEQPTLDFKGQHYDFAVEPKEKKRAEFVKDIICMVNTPRDRSAYIIIGVKARQGCPKALWGVPHHIDDNVLIQKLDGMVSSQPRILYHQVEYEGKQFGVIEIPTDAASRPIVPVKDFQYEGKAILRRNVLYFRVGSVNVEADDSQTPSIHAWFQTRSLDLPRLDDWSDDWNRFLDLTNISGPGRRFLLLLASEDRTDPEGFRHLAWVDWTMVFDPDPSSEAGGVLSRCLEPLEQRRALHRVTYNDLDFGNFERATIWYFFRGIAGRADSLALDSYVRWSRKYREDVRTKLTRLASSTSEPIVLISLWSDPAMEPFIRTILETAQSFLDDRLTSVIVTENVEACQDVARETESTLLHMHTRSFLDGLATLEANRGGNASSAILLPGPEGVPRHIPPDQLPWLEEDLEFVHLHCDEHSPEDVNPEADFLRGGQITWFGLSLGVVIEREKLNRALQCVRADLKDRLSTRVNLLHKPGAGGSTLGRKILWEMRSSYPCAILKHCSPRETVERVRTVFELTEKPVLILREGGAILDRDADELTNQLAAANIPFVLLQVLRRYQDGPVRSRSFFLDDNLTTGEIARFRAKLSNSAPARAEALRQFADDRSQQKTPFLFGLTAYAEDFIGLKQYVRNHLADIPAPQRVVVEFLALAHTYGQATIAGQHFADILHLPRSQRVDLRKALGWPALGLLVEVEPGRWRTAHDLVAREILMQLLGEGLVDERQWQTRLADLGCAFIRFCRPEHVVQADDLLAMATRIFINPNDGESNGNYGSDVRQIRFIQELPSLESRLRVLQALVEAFPESAHFHAHLGRFYSAKMHQTDEAIVEIENALALNERDPVLHHMKGMILRDQVYRGMEGHASLTEILPTARSGSDSFLRARSLAPDEEHGYIAEAQMLLKLLDYAKASQPTRTLDFLAQPNADVMLREAFQTIEGLLAAVRDNRKGQSGPSQKEEACRADLDLLYGHFGNALQRWQNLLDQRDRLGHALFLAPPIRRQIVWAHLARHGRSWSKMPMATIKRCLDLLEANLEEEPGDEPSIRQWLQGIRCIPDPPPLDRVIERVAYWRSNGDTLMAVYYLYVLNALQGLDGSALKAHEASTLLEECRIRSGYRRNRQNSFEWVGCEPGIKGLVNQDHLGEWDYGSDFWNASGPLRRVEAVVFRVSAPQSGVLELANGLKAFFVPSKAGIHIGRSLNTPVTCFLGFSFDGLRAWSVRKVGES